MKIRFLADADLNKAILNGLLRRDPSVDFQTAAAAGLQGKKDLEVLALAAGSSRILVSHDVGTMPAHFRAFREAGNYTPGVFLVSQKVPVSKVIDELLLIWLVSDAADWTNRLEWLPF